MLLGRFTRCNKRHLWSIAVLLSSFLTISSIYRWFFSFNEQHHNTITVLLWHWPFGVPYSLAGDVCLTNYGISGCVLTDNRELYKSVNLVVFHHFELNNQREHLPLHLPRPASQKWVWFTLEAPAHNGNLTAYQNIFNLTMSYHPQADITIPYGMLLAKDESNRDFIPNNKSYEACWVVSNYKKWHKRSAVFEELSKTLSVQVYGRFTQKPLPKDALLETISRCFFYLAFENTVSPHYITEKLWRNAFQAGSVPVVLGPPRKHYEAVAPPTSFIHVDDFTSTAALAEYLQSLIKSPDRYNSYFTWRQNYRVKLYTDWRERLCNICPLYGQFPPQKIYKDLQYMTKQ